MEATITYTRKSSRIKASVVYVESPINKVADEFAVEHGIYELRFKSVVWTKICRMTNKLNAQALKQLFPEALTIRFSHKAGCGCGCSPGFLLKCKDDLHQGKNFWVNIEATEEEVAAFKAQLSSLKLAENLEKEKRNASFEYFHEQMFEL